MALFPHFWSQTLSVASLLVCPLLAAGFTVMRLELPNDLVSRMLIGYCITFSILGTTLIYQIFTIQLKIHRLKK